MKIVCNGRTSLTHGKRPKKPVRWSGLFLVSDSKGNALESAWAPNSGGLMTYAEAREAAINLIDALSKEIFTTHNHPIKKVSFTLTSR